MRIVGGVYKGRVLKSFDGEDIRPTSDMARESLYNILRDKIAGARFLDLFCGTGAMGIEALSRGASEVVFNDYSKNSVMLTKENLAKLKIDKGVKVQSYSAVDYLKITDEKFDIIFMDPPYKSELGEQALSVASNALADGGIVILENESGFDGVVQGLTKYDERKYGRARFTFFKGEKL